MSRRIACRLVGILAAAGCGTSRINQAPLAVQQTGACRNVGGVQRIGLDQNRTMYVEPTTIAVADESVLLAGSPVFIWQHEASSISRVVGSERIFGALLGPAGRTSALPGPELTGSLADLRGTATHDQRFAFLFAQLGTPDDYRSYLGYWYASTDGYSWSPPERLPAPAEGTLLPKQASRLVHASGNLWLAVPARERGATNLAVYLRRNGVWSLIVIPTGSVAYVAITPDGPTGLTIAVVRPNPTFRRDWNSLSLLTLRGERWEDHGFVVRGGQNPVYAPGFATTGRRRALGWLVRVEGGNTREARAALLERGTSLGRVRTLATNVDELAPVTGSDTAPAWVLSTTSSGSVAGLLKLVQWSDTGFVMSTSVPNPFEGRLQAVELSDGVAVTGAIEGQGPGQEPVVSGVLMMTPRCSR